MNESIEERMAQRQAEEDELRRRLATVNLDGPFTITSGNPFFAILGGDLMYAICTICGAMVRLQDPMEVPGGLPMERGVFLHAQWHEEMS